jgi:hypothetical protein
MERYNPLVYVSQLESANEMLRFAVAEVLAALDVLDTALGDKGQDISDVVAVFKASIYRIVDNNK